MKLSISRKLFLAILASAVFIITSLSLATGWSFGRGFLGYLNEQAVERMDTVAPRLARFYQSTHSWEALRDNPHDWFDLVRPIPGEDFPLQTEPPMMPIPDLTGVVLRAALLDSQQKLVIGYRGNTNDMLLRPIKVDGQVVGWLAVAPFQNVSEAGGQRFADYQLRAIVIIGVIALLLAMLIAWWITRTLLRPVKQVAAATHRLAAGDYAERVSVSSNDEVGQLARDFNQLALTLERNERLRREFMADVSHELRTPLAVLRAELEAIEDGVRRFDSETLGSLQGEVAMLSKLVDDLYELSLADVGALTYRNQPLELGELLADSVAMFQERSQAHGLRLHFDTPGTPLPVMGDEQRLRQLLSNVLENSMRYTDTSGQVRVSARIEDQQVVVQIADSGPGVSDEQLPRLFERFYRTDGSRSRNSGGAGLGLAICNSIALAHGGTLQADHSPLGGLQLTLRLQQER